MTSVWRRMKHPTAQGLYDELRDVSGLKLKNVGGKPYAAMMEGEAVILTEVGSKEFFEATDSALLGRKERLATPKVAAEFAELLKTIASAPGFNDELPLGSRGKNWGGKRALLDRELSDPEDAVAESVLSIDLEVLKQKQRPYYEPRSYADSTDLAVMRKAIKSYQNILVEGPPGCGKSTCAKVLAFDLQLPVVRLDLHDSAEPEDLLGKFIRQGDEWVWIDGLLTAMVRSGGVFIAEELESARPEMLSRLHSLLDSRTLVLVEHAGESIPAHPNFCFVATMNPGARVLTARMRERFSCIMVFDYDAAVEERLCSDATLLSVFHTIRADRKVRTPTSTRLLVQYQMNVKIYGAQVALNLFVNHFTEGERPVIMNAFGRGRYVPPRVEAQWPSVAVNDEMSEFFDSPLRAGHSPPAERGSVGSRPNQRKSRREGEASDA